MSTVMKHASVQATPDLQLFHREEAPAKPKIVYKKGIRLRSRRSEKRVLKMFLHLLKLKERGGLLRALKIKKIEVVRPAFYMPTPIPLLNQGSTRID